MLGPVVRQRQEASEAWRNTPVQQKIAQNPWLIDAALRCEPGLKGPAAASLVAAKHIKHSFHCCDPAPHCFISKRSCCSKRGRIQQGEQ